MTDSEQNNEGQNSVADDWENVAEEQVIAQVAERQKQLANKQNEEREAQIAADGHDEFPGPAMPNLDVRSIKLLKRPSSGSCINQLAGGKETAANGSSKAKTLEERQAEYQRVRERIFGDQAAVSPPTEEEPSPESVASGTRSQGQNHLSDVPMKTAADNRRIKAKSTPWAKIPPPQMMPHQSTLYITGTGVYPAHPPGMMPPNTIPYNMPPPILNPAYSQHQGPFMPQQMMAPMNGYFQPPMQNFMQPPLPPNYPAMPLSAMTHVMPDQLKPLHGQNQKSQRNAQNSRQNSNVYMNNYEFPTLQQVMQNPPPDKDSSYGRPPPFLMGHVQTGNGAGSSQQPRLPMDSQPQVNQ